MTACKGTSNRLTQRLQAHSAVLLATTLRLAGYYFGGLRLNRLRVIQSNAILDDLAIANSNTKLFVFTFLTVLPLAGLAAVENKLAS